MKCRLTAFVESGLNRRVPATGLSLFRIFFGMVALQEIIFLFHFRHLIFDNTPYLDPASPIVSLSLLAWSASAFFLMVGLFTRASAIANYSFWVLFLALTPMWHDFDGGFDQLMICSSFLLIFANSERRFSLDNLLLRIKFQTSDTGFRPDSTVPVIHYTILLGVSLGLLYLDAGLHKFHAAFWMNGLGPWVPSTMPYYISPINLDWWLNLETIQKIVGYSLILFQLCFVFLFHQRAFRLPLLTMGCLFHLGILVSLNIYPFGLGMLAHYILLVPFAWWRWFGRQYRHQEPRIHFYFGKGDPRSLQTAMILDHFDGRGIGRYHSVSDASELPAALGNEYRNQSMTPFVAVDQTGNIYRGFEILRSRNLPPGFLYLLMTSLSLIHRIYPGRSRQQVVRPASRLNNPRSPYESAEASKLDRRTICRFLLLVLLLQLNVTVYYGFIGRFGINTRTNQATELASDLSVLVTTTSHLLLGITPHALYMHDHFDGYEKITAFTYIDDTGHEQWVPFVDQSGKFVAPNWGRVHSMWANIAMHQPLEKSEFERLSKRVTAYWAAELGIGTQDTVFRVKSKPVEVSYEWKKDLRQRNLGGDWSNFAKISWKNNRFSLGYD